MGAIAFKILLTIGIIVGAILSVIFAITLISAIVAARKGRPPKKKHVIVYAIIFAASITLTACSGHEFGKANSADAGDGDDSSITTSDFSETTTTVAAEVEDELETDPPEEFPEELFAVNLTKEDLKVWMKDNNFAYVELKGQFSWSSMPAKAKEKKAAILAAIRKYISPTAKAGFDDGVIFPLEYALEHIYDNDGWSKLDEDEQRAEIEEAMRAVKIEILTNPTYTHMWLQMFAQDEVISERNPWVQATLDEWDSYFGHTEDPIGIACFFDDKTEDGPLMLTNEYLLAAARICEVLDFFEYVPEHPIQELLSVKNWCLPPTDANSARTTLSPEQEKYPAIILTARYKSNNLGRIWGVNVLDGRGEIFAIPTPKKETPTPTSTTTVTTTVTTTPTPPVTTTRKTTVTTEDTELLIEEDEECTVVIKYRYEDDKGIVRRRSDNAKYDKKFTVPIGKSFSVDSPDPKYINRAGYRLKYTSDKTVKGIAEDKKWEYTVWYVKDDTAIIIDYPTSTVTTTSPPPVVTTPPKPDGLGGKDPSQGETFGPNRPDDGQGTYEPPAQTTIHDYVTATTTAATTTAPRPETDASGNFTATNSSTHAEGGEKPTETAISTVSHGTDKVNGETVDTGMNNPITAPAD